MRHHALITALFISFTATRGQQAAAQTVWPSGRVLPDGAVTVGRDWAELAFPPLELSKTGCPYTYANTPGDTVRRYGWGVQSRFADATPRDDHFIDLFVLFELPAKVPITDARLDSAFAAAHISVNESRGEPPMAFRAATPQRAWVRREGRKVRLRIEGEEAVQMLLRPRGDSIDISWCRRDDTTYAFPQRTRILRR